MYHRIKVEKDLLGMFDEDDSDADDDHDQKQDEVRSTGDGEVDCPMINSDREIHQPYDIFDEPKRRVILSLQDNAERKEMGGLNDCIGADLGFDQVIEDQPFPLKQLVESTVKIDPKDEVSWSQKQKAVVTDVNVDQHQQPVESKTLLKKKNRINKTRRGQVKQQKNNTYSFLFQDIKKTNMPKYFIRQFKVTLQQELETLRKKPASQQTTNLITSLTKTWRRLKRLSKDKNINVEHIVGYFGDAHPDSQYHRRMMKRRLSQGVLNGILMNKNIDEKNKFTYMKFWRTMEWRLRLNDASLVGRIQSF